jgi:hypothetical protein
LRKNEIKKKDNNGTVVAEEKLADPGRVEGVDEWYFDTRARTIQNGGIHPQWTTPTRLSLDEIVEIIKEGAGIKL